MQFDKNDDPNRRTLSINNIDIKLNVKPSLPPKEPALISNESVSSDVNNSPLIASQSVSSDGSTRVAAMDNHNLWTVSPSTSLVRANFNKLDHSNKANVHFNEGFFRLKTFSAKEKNVGDGSSNWRSR